MTTITLSSGPLEARICPEAGANLYSLRFEGVELLRTTPSLDQLMGHRYGIPVLFPTPGRIRNSRFSFEGRLYHFPSPEGKPYIHGFACRSSWAVESVSADKAVCTLNVAPSSRAYEIFPWCHELKLAVRLSPSTLTLSFEVKNLDWKNLPFGFGFHPYFRIPGKREDVWIQVPAARMHSFEDRVPTGKLGGVEGTPFDLRNSRSLGDLVLDEPYVGLTPGMTMGAEFRPGGPRLSLRASEALGQAVVFAPRGQDFFCLENWSSSPDAHNLHARGFKEESGLIILGPGESQTGWVEMGVSG